jgi:hypothetical protein
MYANTVINDATATLLEMLTWRRPNRSKTERKFINRYLAPLGVRTDSFGNLHKRIGDAPILWSSHVDTVHDYGGRQCVYDRNGIITLAPQEKGSNCLGADCTAGIWIMMQMIQSNVPGLYIFHRAEEIGGLGSRYIAEHNPKALDGVQAAIAFDRRGMTEVISHQHGERCCSNEFARSLCAGIGLSMLPSPNGIFTDTANYTDMIGECTNISVGYRFEHSDKEELNFDHLERLRDRMIAFDWTKLEFKRRPGESEPREYGSWLDDLDDAYPAVRATKREPIGFIVDDEKEPTLEEIIRRYPEGVADYLEQGGIDPRELADYVAPGCYFWK